jgi:hypothetical protein
MEHHIADSDELCTSVTRNQPVMQLMLENEKNWKITSKKYFLIVIPWNRRKYLGTLRKNTGSATFNGDSYFKGISSKQFTTTHTNAGNNIGALDVPPLFFSAYPQQLKAAADGLVKCKQFYIVLYRKTVWNRDNRINHKRRFVQFEGVYKRHCKYSANTKMPKWYNINYANRYYYA